MEYIGMSVSIEFLPVTLGVPENNGVPVEMTLWTQREDYFLPEGRTFEDLNAEEKEYVRNQYRFSYRKSGLYQTITGYKDSF